MHVLFAILGAVAGFSGLGAAWPAGETAVESPLPVRDGTALPDNLPFERYQVKDARGRTITFYHSKASKAHQKLPVLLYCTGSGCQSVFTKEGERISAGVQGFILQVVKGRAHVVVVEKPGVKFLDRAKAPGSSEGGSREYLRDCTPQSWADANIAALRAAWQFPHVDKARTLVLGMSEGGLIAALVAAEVPQVSHVAILSCGGPTQLFDALISAVRPRPGDRPGDGAKRRQAAVAEWAEIRADPDSITKFWMGHPYRRWSSFLKTNTTAALLRAKARVYLAHGTEDRAVPVESHDACEAELLVQGRAVTAERLEGLDHSFLPSNAAPDRGSVELAELVKRIALWFFED
jgi:pimeloyl-ACP methyl ester carboxylesterase